MDRPVRVGVAGIGRIGAMHAEHLAALDRVARVSLYDPAADRARSLAATLSAAGSDVDAVSDVDDLFTADAVLLATPTDTHLAMVRRGLATGTPMLCEKPLAANLAGMRPLVEEIEAAGVPVMVGFQRRFEPAMAELRRGLRAGALGSVYLVRAVSNDHLPPPSEFVATSGGLFRDCVIHDLDTLPWLLDEPVAEVYASGSVLVDPAFADAGDVDNAVVTLRFAGGAHALLSAARHDPLGYDCRLEVFCSRDTVSVGLTERTPLRSLEPGATPPANPWDTFTDRYAEAYRAELHAFLDLVAGIAENPCPPRESLVSLLLAEACESSVRTGAPVRVNGEAVR